MISCQVNECSNNELNCDSTMEFYPFPKIKNVSDQWVKACGLTKKLIDKSKSHICSLHFEEEAFVTRLESTDIVKTLREDAVPALFLPKYINTEKSQHIPKYLYVNLSEADKSIESPSSVAAEIEEEQSHINSNKYSHIETHQDLLRIKTENAELLKSIESLATQVEIYKTNLQDSRTKIKILNAELALKTSNISDLRLNEQEELLSKVFSRNQIKVLNGKKRAYWSNDDMAVGFTIRHLSNRRNYLYLTKTLNIPLPGISSIKKWVAAKKR